MYITLTLIDTEEGHLLIENFVNIFFVTPLSVSLHNLLDFYIYTSKVTGKQNKIFCTVNCKSANVIYILECSVCGCGRVV